MPPTPKRAPGVKRLNTVPKMIGAGVLVIFAVGVIYTAIARHNATVVEQKADKDAKKVEGGHAPGFRPHPAASCALLFAAPCYIGLIENRRSFKNKSPTTRNDQQDFQGRT